MREQWEIEVEEIENARKEKRESKMAEIVAKTNHVGKLKKKKSMRMSEGPKAPRNYTRGTTVINYGSSLGMTTEEYVAYKKTGNLPARLLKEGK